MAGVDFENLGGPRTCTLTVTASFGPVSGARQLTVDIIDVNEPHDMNNLAEDIAIDAATTAANAVVSISLIISILARQGCYLITVIGLDRI